MMMMMMMIIIVTEPNGTELAFVFIVIIALAVVNFLNFISKNSSTKNCCSFLKNCRYKFI